MVPEMIDTSKPQSTRTGSAELTPIQGLDALRAAQLVLDTNFAQLLSDLLAHCQQTRSALYEYVFDRGYDIDQAAMYRYFNVNTRTTRLPAGEKGQQFLALFCDFLELPEAHRLYLQFIWQVQRQQRRKNGAGKIA